jgi:hypothetical protein
MAGDIRMQKTPRFWWIWAACVQCAESLTFVYGCAARCSLPSTQAEQETHALADGAELHIVERVVEEAQFETLLQELEDGKLNLSSLIGLNTDELKIEMRREFIHSVLGQTTVPVEAFCTFLNWRSLSVPSAAWKKILEILRNELGLGFTGSYAAHIGNFEILHIHSWGDQTTPFGIDAVDHPDFPDDRSGVRAFQIFRSEEFAQNAHYAHVAAYESDDRVLDRLIHLPLGRMRSDVLASPQTVERYEFSLFDANDGKLLHHKAFPFLTQTSVSMAVIGRGVEIDDRLSRRAHAQNLELGKKASSVKARTTERFTIDNKSTRSFRQHVQVMKQLTDALFPTRSKDRWFEKTLDEQVGVVAHFNTLLDGGRVSGGILVDPYFGLDAMERLLLRIQSSDVELTIVTSLSKANPDSGRQPVVSISPEKVLQTALDKCRPYINPSVRVVNLVRGNDQAFHDRYLLLYPHEGPCEVFLLSNSINRMAGNWPFCISKLSSDIVGTARKYIEGLAKGEDTTGPTSPTITFEWTNRAE